MLPSLGVYFLLNVGLKEPAETVLEDEDTTLMERLECSGSEGPTGGTQGPERR